MTDVQDLSSLLEDHIKAAQAGDAGAFEAVFDHSYDTLYRYALKWSGNVADAEDIAQLAAIKMAKTLSQFRFESKFTTWIYRLVINTAIDWVRANRRHQEAQSIPPQDVIDPDTGGYNQVYLRQLIDRVADMGEGFKEAIILVLSEGFSHQEAAEVLQVKESTVSWRIHEVRKRLKHSTGEGDE